MRTRSLVLFLLMPLQVDLTDSVATTEFGTSYGGGAYGLIARGCSGVLSRDSEDFNEVGFSVSHTRPSRVTLGLRADRIQTQGDPTGLINPYLRLENQKFAMEIGGIYLSRRLPWGEDAVRPPISLMVRAGRRFFWSASFMEARPLLANGYFQTGIGQAWKSTETWIGMSSGPYDGAGVVGRFSAPVGRNLYVSGNVRLGASEGVSENAFGVGLRFVLPSRN